MGELRAERLDEAHRPAEHERREATLDGLLAQWERSKGALSLQEGFHARHIALSYLPEALKTYLSIPPQFAATRVLRDGEHTGAKPGRVVRGPGWVAAVTE